MPITEGTQEDAKPLVATVDSAALGNAFAHAMQRAGFLPQQASGGQPQAPKTLNEMVSELKKNPDNDEATLDSIKQMFETFRGEIEHSSNQKLSHELARQRDLHTHNVIRMALDSHMDDEVKEYAKELQARVITRFNSEEKYADARARYGNGDVDVEALKGLALDEIKKFNKLRGVDKPSKSPTGMKQGGSMSETAAIAADRGDDGDNTKNVDPDEMDANERSLYNAKLGIAQKMGYDRRSKEALALASKAVRNLRNGKAQAKSQGLR